MVGFNGCCKRLSFITLSRGGGGGVGLLHVQSYVHLRELPQGEREIDNHFFHACGFLSRSTKKWGGNKKPGAISQKFNIISHFKKFSAAAAPFLLASLCKATPICYLSWIIQPNAHNCRLRLLQKYQATTLAQFPPSEGEPYVALNWKPKQLSFNSLVFAEKPHELKMVSQISESTYCQRGRKETRLSQLGIREHKFQEIKLGYDERGPARMRCLSSTGVDRKAAGWLNPADDSPLRVLSGYLQLSQSLSPHYTQPKYWGFI